MFRKERSKPVDISWSKVSLAPKARSAELAGQLDRLTTDQLLGLIELTLAERKRERAWPLRWWLEELLLLVVLTVAGLLVWNGMWAKSAGANRQAVVAAREIPPFHKIAREDVKLAPVGSETPAFNDAGKVIGRYTIIKLSPAQTLKQRQLAPLEWADPEVAKLWRVMTVPLKISPGTLGKVDLPGPVTLVASPHSEKISGGTFDAMLLDYPVADDAKAALVAIREQDLQRLAAVAGESDLFLVRQLR